MPIYSFNRNTAINNTLTRISTATGIDNLTKNSIIRILAESNATDSEFVINAVNETLRQFYIQTATGKFLDAKAFELGLNRNVMDKILIFSSDQSIRLEPLTEGTVFGDYIGTTYTILAGTKIASASNRYNIFITEDTNINLHDSSIWLSVKIEPIDKLSNTLSTFNLQTNQVIQLDPTSPIGKLTNKFQLRITKPIIIETKSESDEELRARLYEAQANLIEGTPDSISLIIKNIPDLLGFNIQQNIRNDNSIDFNIVTKSYLSGSNYSFLPLYIKNLAEDKLSVNTDIQVKFPNRLEIYLEYKTSGSEVVPEQTIKDVIKNTINTKFIYSQTNIIYKDELERLVKNILKDIKTFTITNISGLDSSLQEIVLTSTTDLVVPYNYFCYITSIDQITNVNV